MRTIGDGREQQLPLRVRYAIRRNFSLQFELAQRHRPRGDPLLIMFKECGFGARPQASDCAND